MSLVAHFSGLVLLLLPRDDTQLQHTSLPPPPLSLPSSLEANLDLIELSFALCYCRRRRRRRYMLYSSLGLGTLLNLNHSLNLAPFAPYAHMFVFGRSTLTTQLDLMRRSQLLQSVRCLMPEFSTCNSSSIRLYNVMHRDSTWTSNNQMRPSYVCLIVGVPRETTREGYCVCSKQLHHLPNNITKRTVTSILKFNLL